MAVLVTGPDEKKGQELSARLAELARNVEKTDKEEKKAVVIGPARAAIGKINDIYRFVIYCKAFHYRQLTEIKDKIEEYLFPLGLKEENVQFDFNP